MQSDVGDEENLLKGNKRPQKQQIFFETNW